jgi:hypothetical protein
VDEWKTLLGPAVIAAFVSGIVAFVISQRRFGFDRKLAQQRFDFDKELAQRKFDFDRAQHVHKRRFELAENLLADSYRFRDIMAFVRNGASFVGEGETRSGEDHEAEGIKRLRNMYFVPIERLEKHNEFISGLMAKEYTAKAHFGAEADKAFDLFGKSIRRVKVAAQMLIETAGQQENDRSFNEKMRNEIWSGTASISEGGDEVGREIAEAVSLIEGFCRPVLEWQGA